MAKHKKTSVRIATHNAEIKRKQAEKPTQPAVNKAARNLAIRLNQALTARTLTPREPGSRKTIVARRRPRR